MKKTWFRGLAFTLGIASIPSFAMAQYSNGVPGTGLSGSAFQPLPSVPSGPLNGFMNNRPINVSPAGYAQTGPVGSGVPAQGHVHVPQQPVQAQATILDNQLLNSPYSIGGGQAAPQYEQSAPSMIQGAPASPSYGTPSYSSPAYTQPNYGTTSIAPIPATGGSGSCSTCNNGASYESAAGSYVDGYGMGSCGGGYAAGPSIVSPSPWLAGGNALLFTRADHEYTRLTSDSNMPTAPMLTTDDARMLNTAGFEVFGGRYFGCGRYALVASYWGLFADQQEKMITPGAGENLRSNIQFTLRGPGNASVPYGLDMPTTSVPVYDWYDGAAAHRFIHDQDYQNLELNFFSFALGGGARQGYASGCGSGAYACGSGSCGTGSCGTTSCGPAVSSCATGPTGPCAPWYGAQCSKLRLNMYGGIRWFQFKDYMEYDTSRTDTMFNNGADDFYYRNNVTNNLVGAQLGTMATWCTGRRFNLWSGANFGIYNNRMAFTSSAGSAAELATVLSTNAYNDMPYSFSVVKNDLALLGEGTVGTGICLCRGWTMNLGYRIIGVSGVATSIGQIPRDFSAYRDAQIIQNNHSLILHGLVAGTSYNF